MSKSQTNNAPTLVLYRPQIPANTGNIARTCAATGCHLVLVEPMGFRLTEKSAQRAGLDYWPNVSWEKIGSLEDYLEKEKRPFYFFSSKAKKVYTEIPFTKDDIYIFGSETEGLDPCFLEKFENHFYTLPQTSAVRCLNLSNTAAIVTYASWAKRSFSLQ